MASDQRRAIRESLDDLVGNLVFLARGRASGIEVQYIVCALAKNSAWPVKGFQMANLVFDQAMYGFISLWVGVCTG